MRKLSLIIIGALFFLNCGKVKQEPNDNTEPADALTNINIKGAIYAEQGDELYTKRCDKLTFKALFDTYGRQIDLFTHEWFPGEWHRDTIVCINNGSNSEISRDGLIMLLHALWERKDMDAVRRLYDYGKAHGWKAGDGPDDLTSMAPLVPIMQAMLDIEERQIIEPRDIWTGFRAHLIVLYIHLVGKVKGEISEAYYQMLKKYYKENENNPLISAIYHRYTDGDFTMAVTALNDDTYYPPRAIIEEEDSWPSCPKAVHFLATVGVIDGR